MALDAAAMAGGLTRDGSNTTVAVFFSKLTVTACTPATFRIAVFTLIGHVAQVMLATEKVAVCTCAPAPLAGAAAIAGPVNANANVPAAAITKRFISIIPS